MNKLLAWLGCVVVSATMAKETPKFPVSEIPEDMKTGMYAVIREREMHFEVNTINSASLHYRVVITILNANAKEYASETVGYDKFRVIRNFKGTAYDQAGSVIKRLKQNEIYDQSAFDGFSLYSDNRLKNADLSQGVYPYTVEFEYDMDQKALFYIPDFYLYHDDEVSIQKTSFTLTYPPTLKPRYKLNNIAEPKKSTIDSKESLEWTFQNVKPAKFEKLSPDMNAVVPNILTAPNDFEFDGYAGKMDTWENFGLWINKLNKGRDVLPEPTKQKVRELTASAKTDEEKIKILYEYLQSKTRYVSIQFGIGGFQPFEAATVDKMGYGDCKALSNYMVAMLKEVGIKANYTLIMAGKGEDNMDVNFPSSQFNHAIVCVPNKKDTLWLECTSQISPFGYQGNFTGDRKALIVTENGAKVVNTLQYTADQNLQSRLADVYVEMTGDAKAKIQTRYQGLQYENDHLNFILSNQYDDQKKWVQDNTDIPSFDINSFSMTNKKDKLPVATVQLDLSLRRFATVNGKRIFLTPNLMNRSTYLPEKTDARKNKISLRSSYTDVDTIRYHLPEGIYPEFVPQPVVIKSKFGEYEARYLVDQGNLVYIRRIKRLKGEFPAQSYQELIDFYKSINKADNAKMVFLSKT